MFLNSGKFHVLVKLMTIVAAIVVLFVTVTNFGQLFTPGVILICLVISWVLLEKFWPSQKEYHSHSSSPPSNKIITDPTHGLPGSEVYHSAYYKDSYNDDHGDQN